MTEHDTKDYEHVWPPYGIDAPAPLRTFDLRTTPERMQTWCESLERRIEHLECALHRLLNPSGEPDADEVME